MPQKSPPNFKKSFVNPFVSRVYGLLRQNPDILLLQKMKATLGSCDWQNIRVNAYDTDCNPVSVVLHEALHWFYPKMCESKVLKLEKRIMANLSRIQVKRLMALVSELI